MRSQDSQCIGVPMRVARFQQLQLADLETPARSCLVCQSLQSSPCELGGKGVVDVLTDSEEDRDLRGISEGVARGVRSVQAPCAEDFRNRDAQSGLVAGGVVVQLRAGIAPGSILSSAVASAASPALAPQFTTAQAASM